MIELAIKRTKFHNVIISALSKTPQNIYMYNVDIIKENEFKLILYDFNVIHIISNIYYHVYISYVNYLIYLRHILFIKNTQT